MFLKYLWLEDHCQLDNDLEIGIFVLTVLMKADRHHTDTDTQTQIHTHRHTHRHTQTHSKAKKKPAV